MSDYFERYKRRAGEPFGRRLRTNADDFYYRKLMESSNAQIIHIDGEEYQARVAKGNRIEDLEALFLPNTKLPLGGVVELDDDSTWLIFNTQKVGILPKALLKRANYDLEWEKNGIKYKQPAKVQVYYTLDMYDIEAKTKMDMDVPKGGMFAYMQINDDTKTLQIDDTFVIQGQRYEISGMDNITHTIEGVGLCKYTLDIVVNAPDKETENKEQDENKGGWWN